MQQAQADPLVDTLVRDFGGNYVFALDILEQYRTSPQSVDASWRQYFDRLLGVAPKAEPPPPPNGPAWTAGGAAASAAPAAPAAAKPASGTLVRQPPTQDGGRGGQEVTSLVRQKVKALAVPAILSGDIGHPIPVGPLHVVDTIEA